MWCVCVHLHVQTMWGFIHTVGFTTRTQHTHLEGERKERDARLRRAYYMNETQKSVKFLTVDRYSKINLNLNKHFSTLFVNMKYGCLDEGPRWVWVNFVFLFASSTRGSSKMVEQEEKCVRNNEREETWDWWRCDDDDNDDDGGGSRARVEEQTVRAQTFLFWNYWFKPLKQRVYCEAFLKI